MARLTTKQKEFYHKVVLDGVYEDYDGKPVTSTKQKAKIIKDRFESEYGWAIERMGRQRAMKEWLQGLAINIPFYNSDIIELAKKGGTLPKNATEREEDKIVNNYFDFMASRTLEVIKKYA